MFKQNTERVYPEQVEKSAVQYGATLALCQQIGINCVLHYTGDVDENKVKDIWSHIPRFRLKKVAEIKVDDNLKKVIRTQQFQ
jgi:predicted small metal-binding protein